MHSKLSSAIILSALAMTACRMNPTNSISSKPDDIVLQYFNYAKEAKIDPAMATLCQADQEHKKYFEDTSDIPILPLRKEELLPSYSMRTKCEIKSVNIQNDTATVVTQITHPDIDSWIEHAPSTSIIILVHAHNGIKAAQKVIVESMAATPLVTEERVFDMLKETSGWRINLHLKDFSRIDVIREKASTAESEGNFEAAEAGYNEIVKIYPHHPDISKRLTALKARKEATQAASSYLSKVKINKITTESEDENEITTRLNIKNDSDQAFHRVGIAYQILDQHGKMIQEKIKFEKLSLSQPLAPGSEKDISQTFKDIPTPWKGKIKARVKFLELSKGESAHIPFVEILAKNYTAILSELVSTAKSENKQ